MVGRPAVSEALLKRGGPRRNPMNWQGVAPALSCTPGSHDHSETYRHRCRAAGLLGTLFLASAETRPRIEESEKPPTATADDMAVRHTLQARGAYLSRIGNCMGAIRHRVAGPYAGGHRYTSIGTFITPNITPDSETGIGHWNEDDLWRALHEGKGARARHFTRRSPGAKVTREDSDAIFAYLQSPPC